MIDFIRYTEQDSNHNDLEKKQISDLIAGMHEEDQNAVSAVGRALKPIESLISEVVKKMINGGRLFYIGAGTSGRLGVLDASECPPTFGTDPSKVVGIVAGGDVALRDSIEDAEDDLNQAWKDLQKYAISSKDVVIGIAASGTTPYVVGGIHDCNSHQITTGCITCNPKSPLSVAAQFPIEVMVGPEFLTGSSRLKAGTAQKLILNMISTITMIQLGHVKGNKMVDMQLANSKLVNRATRMVMEALQISEEEAADLLNKHQSIRKAINAKME
tara:strand:+ start:10187 stop:11002 length:816 start_codon:yes stop_codon:yes gene_type:complete